MPSLSASLAPSLTIDGETVPATATFDVINPTTETVLAAAPNASSDQLDAAFGAADRAFAGWARTSDDERRQALHRAADALIGAADELVPLLTAEHGKPLADAQRDLFYGTAWLRYYADLEIAPQILQDDDKAHIEVVQQPLGPVAAIAPSNFPFVLSMSKLGPALRTGNTVVLKPSPYTPLATLRMGELLRGVLPDGVLNVVSGDNAVGAAMVRHPLARKIAFTGSVATGKAIAAAAGSDLRRVTLELGGNDPAIVLEDADIELTAKRIFAATFSNAGQVCASPKRVYAVQSVLPDLVEALAALAAAIRVGDPTDPQTQMGPLNNAAQYIKVQQLVDQAIAAGATAVTGGTAIEGPGYFYPPTILTGANDGSPIVDEEQFGPVLPVIGVRDGEEALARANASSFGLGASVWGRDLERATRFASQVDAGMCWVNTHTAVSADLPFVGAKDSGIGVEGGPWGLIPYTQLKLMYQARQ